MRVLPLTVPGLLVLAMTIVAGTTVGTTIDEDLIVDGPLCMTGEVVTIDASVTVVAGGSLALTGCEVAFIDGSVLVEEGGELTVQGSRVDFARWDYRYAITVEGGSKLHVNGTTFRANHSYYYGGYYILVETDEVTIADSGFHGWLGVYLSGVDGAVLDNDTFAACPNLALHGCSDISLRDCTFENRFGLLDLRGYNYLKGVRMSGSRNVSLSNCTFENYPFKAMDCIDSGDIRVVDCRMDVPLSSERYSVGVNLQGCRDVTIQDTSVADCSAAGVLMTGCDGVDLDGCTLAENLVGVNVTDSRNVTVVRSTLTRNQLGALLENASDCLFTLNNLYLNGWDALDRGDNAWDRDGRGNYWYSYEGVDSDGDGVGDTPHPVLVSSQDRYPLVAPHGMDPLALVLSDPADGETGVPLERPLVLGFNLQLGVPGLLDAVMVTPGADLRLLSNSSRGGVWYFILAPTAGWAEGTTYTVTVTTTLVDLFGRPLDREHTIGFTTGDATPPEVVLRSPANGSWLRPGTPVVLSVEDDLPVTVHVESPDFRGELAGTDLRLDTTNWTDGWALVDVVATDASGNRGRATFCLRVDGTPPALASLEPTDGSWLGAGSVVVMAFEDDAPVSLLATSGSGEWSSDNGSLRIHARSLPDGPLSLVVVARDAPGNERTLELAYTVDTLPPAIELVEPEEKSFITSSTPVLVRVTDEGPCTVHHMPGGGVWLPAGLDGASTFETRMVPGRDGPCLLGVTARDAAGNAVTIVFALVVDDTPPVVSLELDGEGPVHSSPPKLVASVVEEHPRTVRVLIDGVPLLEVPSTRIELNLSGLSDGPHSVKAEAEDLVGHVTTGELRLVMDTLAPVISVDLPGEGPYLRPLAEVTVSQTDENPARLEVLLDGAPLGEAGGDRLVIVLPDAGDGRRVLSARATDLAGHEASLELEVVVDGTPPEVLPVNFRDGDDVAPGDELRLEVRDALPCTTEMRLDGGSWEPTLALVLPGDLAPGGHRVTARAVDAAGNAREVTFRVVHEEGGGQLAGLWWVPAIVLALAGLLVAALALRRGRGGGASSLLLLLVVAICLALASTASGDDRELRNDRSLDIPSHVSEEYHGVLWNNSSHEQSDFYTYPRWTMTPADLDGDGFQDLVYWTETHRLVAVDGRTGEALWTSNRTYTVDLEFRFETMLGVTDLEGDGRPEVLFPSEGGMLNIVDGPTGEVLEVIEVGTVSSQPKFVDVDGDGILDILVGLWAFQPEPIVTCLSGRTLSPIWGYSGTLHVARELAVGDVDDDGDLEVVLTGGVTSYADPPPRYTYHGRPDIVALDARTGNPDWATTGYDEARMPTILDVDGDGAMELVVSGTRAYIFDNGRMVEELVSEAERPGFGLFLAAEWDGDGDVELFTCSGEGLHVYDEGALRTIHLTHEVGHNYVMDYNLVDMDGDGRSDLLFSYHYYQDRRHYDDLFYIRHGSDELVPLFRDRVLVLAGDLDGDGLAEFLLSREEVLTLVTSNEPRVSARVEGVEDGGALYPESLTYPLVVDVTFTTPAHLLREARVIIGNGTRELEVVFEGTALVDATFDPWNASVTVTGWGVERPFGDLGLRFRLNLTLGWNYWLEGPSRVSAVVVYDQGRGRRFDDLCSFRVERGVELAGEPLLATREGEPLPDGHWSASGARLALSGVTVVHRGSGGLPAPPVFGLRLSAGDRTLLSLPMGEADPRVDLAFEAPRRAGGVEPLDLVLALDDLAPGALAGPPLALPLSVDAQAPRVLEVDPPDGTVTRGPGLAVTLVVTDGSGSGLDAGAVEVGVKPGDGDWNWSTPVVAEAVEGGYRLHAVVPLDAEGSHRVVWRLPDVVGNEELSEHRVLRDTTPPEIRRLDGKPWYNTTTVELAYFIGEFRALHNPNRSVEVTTETGEEVRCTVRSSTQYMYIWNLSMDLEAPGSYWVTVGTSDDVGNAATHTSRVLVDTAPPTIDPLVPFLLNATEGVATFLVRVADGGGSGVEGLEYRIGGAWTPCPAPSPSGEVVVTVPLDADAEVELRARDRAGNVAVSGPIRLHLNEPPVPRVTSPLPGSRHRGEVVLDGSSSEDPDGQVLAYRWMLDGAEAGSGLPVEELAPTPGNHTIVLLVSDGFHEVASGPVDFSVEEGEPSRSSRLSVLPLVLLGLVVAALVVAWLRRARSGRP